MKAIALVASVAALLLIGCGSNEVAKPPSPPAVAVGDTVVVGDYELGAPIAAGNVTVVPVLFKSPLPKQGDDITLAEAKKLGLVEIIEIPGAEEVNRLRVHNKSDRPLLLIGGELLLGGKQDRIVVHDVVIPPGATQDVDVDCVEHGRWEGQSTHFDYSSKIVPSSVRDAAVYEDQGKVWENVGKYNEKASPASESMGTTIQIGLNSPDVEKHVQENLPNLMKTLSENERVVGTIYVLNGGIKSMDLFGNPKLFQASKEGLLHSYLAEGAVDKGPGNKLPSPDDYKSFLMQAINGKREPSPFTGVFSVSDPTMKGRESRESGGSSAAGVLIHGSYSNGK